MHTSQRFLFDFSLDENLVFVRLWLKISDEHSAAISYKSVWFKPEILLRFVVHAQRLERTIAAGNKLANLEEREMARMDAFRVAVSFPFSFLF